MWDRLDEAAPVADMGRLATEWLGVEEGDAAASAALILLGASAGLALHALSVVFSTVALRGPTRALWADGVARWASALLCGFRVFLLVRVLSQEDLVLLRAGSMNAWVSGPRGLVYLFFAQGLASFLGLFVGLSAGLRALVAVLDAASAFADVALLAALHVLYRCTQALLCSYGGDDSEASAREQGVLLVACVGAVGAHVLLLSTLGLLGVHAGVTENRMRFTTTPHHQAFYTSTPYASVLQRADMTHVK